jgi:uncharacterized damage-inducible protein DinB
VIRLNHLVLTVRDVEKAAASCFATLTEENLETSVRYRNHSGKSFETSMRNILTHVAMHGQYHPGRSTCGCAREARSR